MHLYMVITSIVYTGKVLRCLMFLSCFSLSCVHKEGIWLSIRYLVIQRLWNIRLFFKFSPSLIFGKEVFSICFSIIFFDALQINICRFCSWDDQSWGCISREKESWTRRKLGAIRLASGHNKEVCSFFFQFKSEQVSVVTPSLNSESMHQIVAKTWHLNESSVLCKNEECFFCSMCWRSRSWDDDWAGQVIPYILEQI